MQMIGCRNPLVQEQGSRTAPIFPDVLMFRAIASIFPSIPSFPQQACCTSSRSYHRRTARYFDQVHRIGLLPFIVGLIAPPLNKPAQPGSAVRCKRGYSGQSQEKVCRAPQGDRATHPPGSRGDGKSSGDSPVFRRGDHSSAARDFQAR